MLVGGSRTVELAIVSRATSDPSTKMSNLSSQLSRSHLQHRHRIEQFTDDIERLFAFDLGFGADDQAMPQHAGGDGLHVFMREVMAAIQRGARAGATQQAQRSPRTGAE